MSDPILEELEKKKAEVKKTQEELELAIKFHKSIKRKAKMEKDAKERLIFREMLFKRYGVEDNPKRDMCYNIAWDMGHAYGLLEVEHFFSTLVELIK